jgi:hypothetical protein
MKNAEQRRAAAQQFLRLASLRPTSSTFALLNELSGLTRDELHFQEDEEDGDKSERPTSSSSTLSTATFLSLLGASSSVSSFGSRPNSSKSSDFEYPDDYEFDDGDEDYSQYIYRTAPSSAQSAREPKRPLSSTHHTEESHLRPSTAICLMREMENIPYFVLPKPRKRQLSFQDLIDDFDDTDIKTPMKSSASKVSFDLPCNLDEAKAVDEILIFKSLSRPQTGNMIKEVIKYESIKKASSARTKKTPADTLKKKSSTDIIPSVTNLFENILDDKQVREFKSSFPTTPLETIRPRTQTMRAQSRAKSSKKTTEATKKKKKCDSCSKKLSLTSGFNCRCGLTFCSTHRYSDRHACTFDYKEHGRNELIKANPIIQSNRSKMLQF